MGALPSCSNKGNLGVFSTIEIYTAGWDDPALGWLISILIQLEQSQLSLSRSPASNIAFILTLYKLISSSLDS